MMFSRDPMKEAMFGVIKNNTAEIIEKGTAVYLNDVGISTKPYTVSDVFVGFCKEDIPPSCYGLYQCYGQCTIKFRKELLSIPDITVLVRDRSWLKAGDEVAVFVRAL